MTQRGAVGSVFIGAALIASCNDVYWPEPSAATVKSGLAGAGAASATDAIRPTGSRNRRSMSGLQLDHFELRGEQVLDDEGHDVGAGADAKKHRVPGGLVAERVQQAARHDGEENADHGARHA